MSGEASGEHTTAQASGHSGPKGGRKSMVKWAVIGVVAVGGAMLGVPWVREAMSTVSTDDAYVAGHATLVAARVGGQVAQVLVDDNNRVRKGDVLVRLDREPYEVAVAIADAAVGAARSDLDAATAQAQALVGQTRSLRFALQRAIEDVDNQVAVLRSRVATLESHRATLRKVQADYDRALPLAATKAISAEEIDHRRLALDEQKAMVEQALQGVYQVRVSLGLPPKPEKGDDLSEVPADLDQTFSAIRQAQASLMQSAAQVGVVDSFNKTPKQMIEDFYKRDPEGNVDRIYAKLIPETPVVRQAAAKLMQADRNLDQARLNLRYCDVVAEIDGVVVRREVNPGNNVVAGQALMVVRSLTDVWVDANFKETQLKDIRIGQPVDIEADLYGGKKVFKGRVSGFSAGTGSTLSLLPAENATGNFVKVVQRLPVRVDLVDYDPEANPLFVGLSVTPKVRVKEEPTGENAGKVLQPRGPGQGVSAGGPTTAGSGK